MSRGVVWKILMVHSLVGFFRVVVFVDGAGVGLAKILPLWCRPYE